MPAPQQLLLEFRGMLRATRTARSPWSSFARLPCHAVMVDTCVVPLNYLVIAHRIQFQIVPGMCTGSFDHRLTACVTCPSGSDTRHVFARPSSSSSRHEASCRAHRAPCFWMAKDKGARGNTWTTAETTLHPPHAGKPVPSAPECPSDRALLQPSVAGQACC